MLEQYQASFGRDRHRPSTWAGNLTRMTPEESGFGSAVVFRKEVITHEPVGSASPRNHEAAIIETSFSREFLTT